jgi:thiamine biosynthesis lipoprotein
MQTDERFRHVFTLAQRISEATGGAFDITVAPLVNAWGFGFKQGTNPSDAQIDSLRQFVGMDKVQLQGDTLTKTDPCLMLDCSAIAKGYGVDGVADYLEGTGIHDYMIEIGGEIRVSGTNPQGKPWHIGIIKPVDDPLAQDTGDIQQVVEVSNTAIATSGNYRNYYEQDGRKIAHTIDPRTGRPVQRNILSATVLAPDCATADAFATAFMVVGLDEARQILEKQTNLKAYFICADKQGKIFTWHSPTLQVP